MRLARKLLVTCIVGVALAGTVAFRNPHSAGEALVTDTASMIGSCGYCDLGGGQTHYFKGNGPYPNVTCAGSDGSSCHEDLRSGHCYAIHYECSFLLGLLPAVEDHLKRWEPEQIRALVSEGKVVVNEERRALQVKNCDGQIAGHYPLTRHQLRELAAA